MSDIECKRCGEYFEIGNTCKCRLKQASSGNGELQDYWFDPYGYPPDCGCEVLLRCFDDAEEVSEVYIGHRYSNPDRNGNDWSVESHLTVTGWMPKPKV